MITLLVSVNITPGAGSAFEAAFAALAAKVRATEPGNKGYRLYSVKKAEDSYRFIEHYASPEAFQAHRDNQATKEEGNALRSFFADTPVIEILTEVGA